MPGEPSAKLENRNSKLVSSLSCFVGATGQQGFDRQPARDYHESCASKPGDRCPVLAPVAGPQGLRRWLAGMGERKVRTPQGSVLANGEGWRGIPDRSGRTPPIRIVPQKTYRPVLLRLVGVENRVRVKWCGKSAPPR